MTINAENKLIKNKLFYYFLKVKDTVMQKQSQKQQFHICFNYFKHESFDLHNTTIK